jgi:bifunctional non-homologous end joining protein LigD
MNSYCSQESLRLIITWKQHELRIIDSLRNGSRLMSLQEYERKRNFSRTPEPKGKRGAPKMGRADVGQEGLYTIQKHSATRLHYDLRLQVGGSLKSWAVPRGPSLDPKESRLAIQVEDHPLDYAEFEGSIPEGNYGAGNVIVWDRGEWKPQSNAVQSLERGKLTFQLFGEKLKGTWTLIRMRARKPGKAEWILKKVKDAYARSADDYDICEALPESVKTGKVLKERKKKSNAGTGRIHIIGGTPSNGKPRRSVAKKAGRRPDKRKISTADVPVDLQFPTLSDVAPHGDDWLHEIKLDGYRIGAEITDEGVRLLTRNDKDWAKRFSALSAELSTLPVSSAVLDGEVVIVSEDGKTSFQGLQQWLKSSRGTLRYIVFDLLELNGEDLREQPLIGRKERLSGLFDGWSKHPLCLLNGYMIGSGAAVWKEACAMGLEGIVSKQVKAAYTPGRNTLWLKCKCTQQAEFVIGGYTCKPERPRRISALLLGYYDDKKSFRYASKVGTGFTEDVAAELLRLLVKEKLKSCPFVTKAPTSAYTSWVRPKYVAQIEFTERTEEGALRHPVFAGLREDKNKEQVQPPEEQLKGMPAVTSPKRSGKASKSKDQKTALTHPDKILYPEQGITKRALAEYYLSVAEFMLPEVINRPLVLLRCPGGISRGCFFQKHVETGENSTLPRVSIRGKTATEEYLSITGPEHLLELVQLNTLEIHTWPVQVNDLEHPDRMIFDLDPDPALAAENVIDCAKKMRRLLEQVELESFVRVTGGKGLHLVVPLAAEYSWEHVKNFAASLAAMMVEKDPSRYTAVMSKQARRKKIFIDYFRNGRAQTSIANYSTRARPGAPVSVPLRWEEVKPGLRFDSFDIQSVLKRLHRLRKDPWEGIAHLKQKLLIPD